jgi:hypothetical protein
MRVMLCGVDQAVADGGDDEQVAVRRRIGTSPL